MKILARAPHLSAADTRPASRNFSLFVGKGPFEIQAFFFMAWRKRARLLVIRADPATFRDALKILMAYGHERTPQKRPTIVSATHRMQFTRRCHDES